MHTQLPYKYTESPKALSDSAFIYVLRGKPTQHILKYPSIIYFKFTFILRKHKLSSNHGGVPNGTCNYVSNTSVQQVPDCLISFDTADKVMDIIVLKLLLVTGKSHI